MKNQKENQMKNQPNQELIGKYVSMRLWTDVQIIGIIIGVRGKSIIEIQKMEATKQTEKLDFHIGGFSAHCSNNYNQKWEFAEIEGKEEMRLGKSFEKRYSITESPRHFYDYNF